MLNQKRKLWAFLILALIGVGCNFPLQGIPSDSITFAQRGSSRLTPVGNVAEPSVEPRQTPTGLPLGLNQLATMTAVEATRIAERGEETQMPTHSLTNTQTASPTNTLWTAPSPTFTSIPPQPPTATVPQSYNPPPPTATNTPLPPPTSTNTNTPNLPPTPTKTQAEEPTQTNTPTTCNPSGNSVYESQVIALINQERADEGVPPLSSQSQLTSAARIHSADMACNGFFSHTSPTTGSPYNRITAQGYSYSAAGENIAAGYSSAASVVDTWMNSADHRANILSPNYVHIGVGYAYWGDSTYGAYWTAVFASP